MKECRALGASELEYDYKLTALRMIATNPIREKTMPKCKKRRTKRKGTKVNWTH